MKMSVIVRFAPSPTGFLHIGGARTALFNWLFARHHKGKFLMRIEDTDRERSTEDAIDAIFESLKWLGIDWDNEPVFQFANAKRHAEVAHELVNKGLAYYCYCSQEELEQMREDAMKNGLPPRYNGLWRNKSSDEAPIGVNPVVRFKAPIEGKTVIHDLVQGEVEMNNSQLDDMVLLRADGTPTYMLSVVVDDHDMEITHIIRGDDHLTNAFRQYHLYKACGWDVPFFAHIPLIHGPDGAKLSKRHGALGAEQYKEMGFLPEAMRNYLLRLGWAHGNDEIISTQEAIQWFDLNAVGRSPARFDMAKLTNLNGHYIRSSRNERLLNDIKDKLKNMCTDIKESIFNNLINNVLLGMDGLKERSKTLVELAENSVFYIKRPTFNIEDDIQMLKNKNIELNMTFLDSFNKLISSIEKLDASNVETCIRDFCKNNDLKLGEFLYPVRIAITGKTTSPSLFEVVEILKVNEINERINSYNDFLKKS